MKKAIPLFIITLLGWVVLTQTAGAKIVEHHGQKVESNASVQACLSCHDGSIAGHVSTCTTKCNVTTPHAIMREYPPRGKELEYAPLAVVKAKGIKFVNGKIACISCHDLQKKSKNHLINEKNLCGICHYNK